MTAEDQASHHRQHAHGKQVHVAVEEVKAQHVQTEAEDKAKAAAGQPLSGEREEEAAKRAQEVEAQKKREPEEKRFEEEAERKQAEEEEENRQQKAAEEDKNRLQEAQADAQREQAKEELARPYLPVVSALLHEAVQAPQDDNFEAKEKKDDNFEAKEKEQDRHMNSEGLRLLSGACCLPHPEKMDKGGEDAYFICSDKEVIGVADGVGSWAGRGVDAGEYARQLMNQSLIAVRQEPRGCIDVARVLEIAHSKTYCRGSSTACILALSDYGLQAANVGDSGFLVLRNGRVIFKSPAQLHSFNFPFQLERRGDDPPTAAQVFTVDVTVGDVVVAGTDGLFDNLFDTELTSVVVQAAQSGFSPDITAQKIASLARERAQDCLRQTPFSTAAQEAGFRYTGGKMDDITVIVSFVTSDTTLS